MGVERPLRAPPSVDAILRSPVLEDAVKTYAHQPLVRLIRETVDSARRQTSSGGKSTGVDELALEVLRRITTEWTPAPRYVLNATGVLLHTNLGRARLSEEAMQALQRTSSYSDVELDLETGARGRRNSNLEAVLRALTGAEAATAVTNNAAAVLLCLTALARGKEVIVSRGQAVEIGGGFRIPAILAQSGSRLVEVGTTNRTRVDDYDSAITARSAAILHVHRSNFQIVGFTDEPSISELAALAHERDLLLIADNGSGALLDTARFGLRHEPTPIEAIADGADVVAFSGDKMLGGPQSGILAGTEAPIRRIERHPLARAMRLDKLILAALSATLQSYLRGSASTEIPFWRMVAQSNEYLRQRAEKWASIAARRGIIVDIVPDYSTVGGGSLPGQTLPTTLIRLPRTISASRLRRQQPPVVGRAREGHVMLDLRTIAEEEEFVLLDSVAAATMAIDGRKNAVLDSVD